jgi:arginine N-succinyltransferase
MLPLVVRAIRAADFDGLMALAQQTGAGMTTLKADEPTLRRRVQIAVDSFAERIPPEQRDYLFVMEDLATATLVGVCAIKSSVGLDEPFYNYRIGTLVHSSKELKVFSQMETLYLANDLTGCAELCSLFLLPAYRTGNNGRLLSKSRFLFIAQFPHLFESKLIAEMRGFLHDDGRSPFWDSLGRHFFKMDFNRADDYSGLGQKSFIAELMPRYPLYVACLPEAAQQVIGQVHVATAPAKRLLEQEGMYFEGYIDIFDAGPVLQARIAELRALRESELVVAATRSGVTAAAADTQAMLVSTTGMQDFRIITTDANPQDGHIALGADALAALACAPGSTVRSMTLNPKKSHHA